MSAFSRMRGGKKHKLVEMQASLLPVEPSIRVDHHSGEIRRGKAHSGTAITWGNAAPLHELYEVEKEKSITAQTYMRYFPPRIETFESPVKHTYVNNVGEMVKRVVTVVRPLLDARGDKQLVNPRTLLTTQKAPSEMIFYEKFNGKRPAIRVREDIIQVEDTPVVVKTPLRQDTSSRAFNGLHFAPSQKKRR